MSKIFKINIFSVHSAGVYKNRANAILFPIFGTLATLNLPIKSELHQGINFFSDANLASNYHGCKKKRQ